MMSAMSRFTAFHALVASVLLCALPAAADAPRNVAEYVLLSDSKVKIGKDTFVAEGNVGTNAAGILLRRRVFTSDGSAVVADKVELGKGTSVDDLFANTLDAFPGEFVIRGSGPLPLTPPVIAPLP